MVCVTPDLISVANQHGAGVGILVVGIYAMLLQRGALPWNPAEWGLTESGELLVQLRGQLVDAGLVVVDGNRIHPAHRGDA
jgi:hypothetical protein